MFDGVVTADALHANQKTFDLAFDVAGCDLLICIKRNTKLLLQNIIDYFDEHDCPKVNKARTIDKGHGRIEERSIEAFTVSPQDVGWKHIHTIAKVKRKRITLRGDEVLSESDETVYYAGTCTLKRYSASDILTLTRGHWCIENGLHHRKDRSMDEDRNSASKKGIAQPMCFLRSIAAQILGSSKETIGVIRTRLITKPQQLVKMVMSGSTEEWVKAHKPFKI